VTRAQERPPGKRQYNHEYDGANEHATPIRQSLRHVANCDNGTVTCL